MKVFGIAGHPGMGQATVLERLVSMAEFVLAHDAKR